MRKIFSFLAGLGIGAFSAYTVTKYFEPPQNEAEVDKYRVYYNLLCKWCSLEDEGRPVDALLEQAGYRRIAIYGMGHIGIHLFHVLKNTKIDVVYGIDGNTKCDIENLHVYSVEDDLPEVDAIVVTVPFAFLDIKRNIEKKINYPVISLEHILFEV